MMAVASWAEKLTKTRVSILMNPSVYEKISKTAFMQILTSCDGVDVK